MQHLGCVVLGTAIAGTDDREESAQSDLYRGERAH